MRKEWDQLLCLAIKPLLIAEEEIDDHYRCTDEVVIEISLDEAYFRKLIDQPVHDVRSFLSVWC